MYKQHPCPQSPKSFRFHSCCWVVGAHAGNGVIALLELVLPWKPHMELHSIVARS